MKRLERALAGPQAAPAALALEAPRRFAARGAAGRGTTAASLFVDLVATALEAKGRLLGRRRRRTETGPAVAAAARRVAAGRGTAAEARPRRTSAVAAAATTAVAGARASTAAISAALTGRTTRTLLRLIHVEPTTADIALVEQRDGLLRLRLR